MSSTSSTLPPASAAPPASPVGPAIDFAAATPESAVAQYIRYASEAGASDLFFTANARHVAVQMRHLGIMRPIGAMPLELGRRALAHVKASAGIDTTEKRRPLDGRWKFDPGTKSGTGKPASRGAVSGVASGPSAGADEAAGLADSILDLRINVIPTLHGEDAALRLLRRDNRLVALNALGMTREQLGLYSAMLDSPSGLILITGPAGAGKTATLYASLMHVNAVAGGTRKINTIEDPIEFPIEGLRQSQVNPTVGLGFADLLRGILRQSSDVIMIGEVRDVETAEIAVRAANSGVLVFATLHAPSAPAAVQSMRSLGGNSHFLASSLRGVVAQRLLRTLCPQCRTSFDLSDSPHTFDEVRPLLGPDEGKTLFAPHGCPACGMSGYAGRTGVFEVMPVTSSLRELITDNRPAREIRAKAAEQKMLEFRQAALLKVARGSTSTEEVFRVIPTENLMMED